MFQGTSKERFFYHNTLLCLVNSLQGQKITLDVRNDAYVCGEVDSVDGFMNITFKNAVYCDSQGNEFAFDNLYIQGRNIRYVHIPDNISMVSAIKNEATRTKMRPESTKKLTEKTRKTKKALQQHLQTVASLDI
ncbi:hypothetical protein K1T71_003273 [Dendrolimus kikuchii]|uniref:Uncharacterized protein n=1 Tax=Dendrolimus kikuchii TaxID=765133 RepID=A0ACC1DB86_9NEOP|nr:hypothetical protein K1T71_003273 [Dendrolimus kikuchii]